jgi:hypothetical protein
MRVGTWSVNSLHKGGSRMTVAKEISKYKLGNSDGKGVSPNQQGDIRFFM